MDSLDSVWLGMKLGIAVIGILMMGFVWRGIWRSKRAGEHKHTQALGPNAGPVIAQALHLVHEDSRSVVADK